MFNSYYKNVVRQDLLTKFHYQNSLQISSLEKIVLSFSFTSSTLKNFLPLFSALQLISCQKPYVIRSKRINLTLKLKHGSPIGCKVDLRGKEIYIFLEKLFYFILPQLREFHGFEFSKKDFALKIENLFTFRELEKDYEHFSELPPLTISFVCKTAHFQEKAYLLNSLKFPFSYK
jgi:large subunit ribosomal protein L5